MEKSDIAANPLLGVLVNCVKFPPHVMLLDEKEQRRKGHDQYQVLH